MQKFEKNRLVYEKLSFIAVFMAALTIIGFSATGCSDKNRQLLQIPQILTP